MTDTQHMPRTSPSWVARRPDWSVPGPRRRARRACTWMWRQGQIVQSSETLSCLVLGSLQTAASFHAQTTRCVAPLREHPRQASPANQLDHWAGESRHRMVFLSLSPLLLFSLPVFPCLSTFLWSLSTS